MPISLHFDGDKRRIYEVPENSSFVVDGQGYRIYTPIDIPSADVVTRLSSTELWSRSVDFLDEDEWAYTVFKRDGGASRGQIEGIEVSGDLDIRLINNWELVIANYPHEWIIDGNLFGDALTDKIFDTSRLSTYGAIPRINSATSNQILKVEGVDNQLVKEVHMAHYNERWLDEVAQQWVLLDDDGVTEFKRFQQTIGTKQIIRIRPL